MNKAVLLGIVVVATSRLFAQQLPDIFKTTSKELLASKTITAYPRNTWLENLVVDNNGVIYATDYPEGKIFRIQPDGSKEVYTSVPGKIAGISFFGKNNLLAAGWDKQGKACLFRIDQRGQVSRTIYLESGMFPNGLLHFHGNQYLVADSYAGCIWLYDADADKVKCWLKSKWLERSSPKAEFPAANGLKIYHNTLYVSNTERQLIISVPLHNYQPEAPSLFIDKVNVDDFTFDDAGNIYAATNVYNSVIKITPLKKTTIVADLSTGAAGATAVVFRRNKAGNGVLYVTTSGGMGVPPPSGVEEGKVIELLLP